MKVNKKLLAALCGAPVVLLALSACGGDDSAKRDDWAKGVCGQAAVQLKKIDDANVALSRVDGAGKPQDIKNADAAAFQTISDAYKSLAGIFGQTAKAPTGDEATKYQQDTVAGFTSLSSQYAALKTKTAGLATTDQGKFADGLRDVFAELTPATAHVQTVLGTVRQGDLGKALAKQQGCQRVSAVPQAAS